MTKSYFLKNMKSAWPRFKFLGIAILALIIFIPLLVLSYNTPDSGYRVVKNITSQPVFHYADNSLSFVSPIGACIYNNSGNDYFVPTRTINEWTAFMNGQPSGATPVTCCGDGECSGADNCSNCPGDCCPNACDYWFYTQWTACYYNQSREAIVKLPFNCTGGTYINYCGVGSGADGCASGFRCTHTATYAGSGCSGSPISQTGSAACVTSYIPDGCSNYTTNGVSYSINFWASSGCTYRP